MYSVERPNRDGHYESGKLVGRLARSKQQTTDVIHGAEFKTSSINTPVLSSSK
jgi:hypothetical protein